MDSPELAQLLATAEQLSPERHPDEAIALNQRIVQLDPRNAAAYLRMARGYQAQRDFAAAAAACQEALRYHPQSTAARRRLQRINEEWGFYRQAQTIATYDEAIRRGSTNRDQERIGEAIAFLWRALELSTTQSQSIRCHNALGAAYRSRKDPTSLDRAAEQYEWVLRHAPRNLIARRGLAAVLREQWEMSQVQELYERQHYEGQEQAQQGRQQWGSARAYRYHQQEYWKQRAQRKRTEQRRKPAHQTVKKPKTLTEALKILNLRPPVTRTEIKRAYRAQAQLAHPDHGGSHAEMVRLNAAYELALTSA